VALVRGRSLLVLALAAVVLVPSASAGRAPRLELALVPLPRSALGAAGRPLTLAHDSGAVSNQEAAGNSLTGTPERFNKLGRVTGYLLNYGDAFRGGTGVTAIRTGVERYRSAAAARRGLAFWRADDATFARLRGATLGVALRAPKAPRVGTRRFASLVTLTVPDVQPVTLVDELVQDGPYVLEASVSAGSSARAEALAPKLVRKLERRFRLALAGRLRTKPVRLPAVLKAGPPAGGPDLASLTFAESDFSPPATVLASGYFVDPGARSAYSANYVPAGRYDLTQQVEWYSTTQEAMFVAAFENAVLVSEISASYGVSQVRRVDLGSVGDRAEGTSAHFTQSGQSGDAAFVVLTRGRAVDAVYASTRTQILASDVQSLAQAAAKRLDVGVVAG
jgi:hypothetical protein